MQRGIFCIICGHLIGQKQSTVGSNQTVHSSSRRFVQIYSQSVQLVLSVDVSAPLVIDTPTDLQHVFIRGSPLRIPPVPVSIGPKRTLIQVQIPSFTVGIYTQYSPQSRDLYLISTIRQFVTEVGPDWSWLSSKYLIPSSSIRASPNIGGLNLPYTTPNPKLAPWHPEEPLAKHTSDLTVLADPYMWPSPRVARKWYSSQVAWFVHCIYLWCRMIRVYSRWLLVRHLKMRNSVMKAPQICAQRQCQCPLQGPAVLHISRDRGLTPFKGPQPDPRLQIKPLETRRLHPSSAFVNLPACFLRMSLDEGLLPETCASLFTIERSLG